MFKQKPFLFSLVVLLILIILHLVGSIFSLYWRYPGYDIIVHIISGLWVALLWLWLVSVLGQINSLKQYKLKSLLTAIVSATLLGIIWELVENLGQTIDVSLNGYGLDTASDIASGLVGGLLAFWYFIKRRRQLDPLENNNLHPFYSQTGIIKS